MDNLMKKMKSYCGWVWQYVWLNLTGMSSFLFFHVFNRTKVYGRENIPRGLNTLFVANHRTMIDSFLIGQEVCFPRSLFHPELVPYSPAASENFFRNRTLALMSKSWKCIPVDRSRHDLAAMRAIMRTLKSGNVILFPEGTRSRTGKLGEGKNGIGMIIREVQPVVVPVYVNGMERVLPIGTWNPRIGQKVTVHFGKPLNLSQYMQMGDRRDAIKSISRRVMAELALMERGYYFSGSPQDGENLQALS